MKHIYESIPGWFSFEKFYSDMVKRFPSGSTFVEVGTYKGRSFSYLVVEVINSGKDIECIGIDACCWDDVEPEFNNNMFPLQNHYKFLKGESSEVLKTFADKSIDFAFIDANHTYEFVKRDIETILPKMKPGGILAGHDCNDQHPGVVKAVNELFFGKFNYDQTQDVWSILL